MRRFTPDFPLILASRSPRRIQLLTELGIPLAIHPSNAEEPPHAGASPDLAAVTARIKAADIARHFPHRVVLGADTIVCLEDHILGKPADEAEARRMLRTIRDRWHVVVTGLCIVGPGGDLWIDEEATRVRMNGFSDEEMDEYIATGEPLDKAGAYAIQGEAARFVRGVEGDYFNVVGLPIELMLRGLARFADVSGFEVPRPPERFREPPK